jgi:glycosyltransferase involved in cell wall biosynthesis
VNILYLSNKRRWGGILSWMEKTALGLESKGHKVYILSNPKSIFMTHIDMNVNIRGLKFGFDYNPVTLLKVIYFIKKNKIDIVLSNIKKEVIIASLASKICGIPHVRRIGTEFDCDIKPIQRTYKRNLIHGTISPCDYMNRIISNKYSFIRKDQMYHVYNGRNTLSLSQEKIAKLKKHHEVNHNNIVIGTICQLSKIKNVVGLINVFSKLRKKYDNIDLVIAGRGAEQDTIIEKIKELKLNNCISFLGFVRNAQEIASMFDIGVLFSYAEGFSNSIVEYMSVGAVPICSRVGGQDEIIIDEDNGYLIEAGNEEELYNRIERLITNPELRNSMSKKAFNTVGSKFTESNMVTSVEKIYNEIIARYKA